MISSFVSRSLDINCFSVFSLSSLDSGISSRRARFGCFFSIGLQQVGHFGFGNLFMQSIQNVCGQDDKLNGL